MRNSKIQPSGGPRRASEEKMMHSPKSKNATRSASIGGPLESHSARQRSKSESQHHSLTKQKSEDRFRWKEQLKFRAFKGKRGSESKEKTRELVIVHTTHDELSPKSTMLHDVARPEVEEGQGFFLRPESEVSLRDRELQQTWQDYSVGSQPRPFQGIQDAEDSDGVESEDSNPWHLEERLSAATAFTTRMMDVDLQHVPNAAAESTLANGSMSKMSGSDTNSDVSSLRSFLGETELNLNDDSDSESNEEVVGSPGASPHTGAHHNSWNWAVPIQQPSALAPAPPPRPVTGSRPVSPSSELRITTATVTTAATASAPATALKANMVSIRRPSRPDNPWSWKLPAPDPSAPKINTVIVRRPSHAQWNPSSGAPSPNLSKSSTVSSPKSSKYDDGIEVPSSTARTFSRRPSRADEPILRPPKPPPVPTSSLVRDVLRRPSRPDEALSSHPIRIRQDSMPDTPCRMCHASIAEAWGVCRDCEEELTPGTLNPKFHNNGSAEKHHRLARKGSRPAPIQTHHQSRARNYSCASMASYSSSVASSINTPTTGSMTTSLSTPMTGSFHTALSRLPPNVQSVIAETEITERSPPISPTCRVAQTEVAIPPSSSTSLSGMPTPDLLARYQLGTEKFADQPARRLRPDMYNDESSGYYFDAENFEAAKNRPRTKSTVTQEQAQGFMAREVALEEYDGFWGDPLSPGPGWI